MPTLNKPPKTEPTPEKTSNQTNTPETSLPKPPKSTLQGLGHRATNYTEQSTHNHDTTDNSNDEDFDAIIAAEEALIDSLGTLSSEERTMLFQFNQYSVQEVVHDIKKIRDYRNNPKFRKELAYESDSKSLETAVFAAIANDLFGESQRYGTRAEHQNLVRADATISRSFTYDDWFRHADLVCTIQNPDTDNEPLVFAIDTTFKIGELGKKFSNGQRISGIHGFTDLRYYRGAGTGTNLQNGPQENVPLFIVGFSHFVANDIAAQAGGIHQANGQPLDPIRSTYQVTPTILSELLSQTEQNLQSLNRRIEHTTNKSKLQELKDARIKLIRLKKYFEGAERAAKEHPERSKYMERPPANDSIANAIKTY